MSRPPLEVADIIRAAGDAFIERNRHWLGWKHVKVLLAIARCRTAALGGHLDQCTRCGHRAISFNSCRNRHCPKCQTAARERWIAARQRELLPTCYLHVVFTLPRHLAPLALQNKKVIYDLLFRTSAETLLEVARNPEHLGAEIGFFSVLHTCPISALIKHWSCPQATTLQEVSFRASCVMLRASWTPTQLKPAGWAQGFSRLLLEHVVSGSNLAEPVSTINARAQAIVFFSSS